MNDLCLSNKSVSIAKAYTAAGYDTAYIGKWHLDGHGRSSYIPKERRQGFNYWKVLECTHDYNNSYYYEGDSKKLKKWDGYDAFAQTHDAVEYIKSRKGKDKPFLLMISYGTPHNPYNTVPDQYLKMYPKDEIKLLPNIQKGCEREAGKNLQGYYAHISALDKCVGMINRSLKEIEIDEHTVLVLTSDHGDSVMSHCKPETGNINKQRPYDESIKVPFLVRYPALFGTKKSVVSTPFTAADIMPTLLELCGVNIPDTVEGISFAPVLSGKGQIERKGVLIACYVPFADWNRERGGREYRGIRTERYTYVKTLKGPWMLFDNENDPYQLDNMVNNPRYKKIQGELEKMLQKLLEEQKDDFVPGYKLCKKYGYHSLDEKDCIPVYKDDEWFLKAQEVKEI